MALPELEPEHPMEPGPELQTGVEPSAPLPPPEPLATSEAAPLQLTDVLSDATTDLPMQMRPFDEANSTSPEPEPSTTLPDLEAQEAFPELEGAGASVEEPATQPLLESLETGAGPPDGVQAGAEALDFLPPAEPASTEPEAPLASAPAELTPATPPWRPSLAERIDAAVEASESSEPAAAEALAWGAVPLVPEPLAPEDLGATPLDVADPAAEFAVPGRRPQRAVLGGRGPLGKRVGGGAGARR
jgi:hypothetical protein